MYFGTEGGKSLKNTPGFQAKFRLDPDTKFCR